MRAPVGPHGDPLRSHNYGKGKGRETVIYRAPLCVQAHYGTAIRATTPAVVVTAGAEPDRPHHSRNT